MVFDTEKYLEELIKTIKEEKRINTEKAGKGDSTTPLEVSATFKVGETTGPFPQTSMYINPPDKYGKEVVAVNTPPTKSGNILQVNAEKIETTFSINIPSHMPISKNGEKIDIPTFTTESSGLSINKGDFSTNKVGKKILTSFKEKIRLGRLIETLTENEIRGNKIYETVSGFNTGGNKFLTSIIFDDNISTATSTSVDGKKELFNMGRNITWYDETFVIHGTGKPDGKGMGLENNFEEDKSYDWIKDPADRYNDKRDDVWSKLSIDSSSYSTDKNTDRIISGGGAITQYMTPLANMGVSIGSSFGDMSGLLSSGATAVFSTAKQLDFSLSPITDKEIERTFANIFTKNDKAPPKFSLMQALKFGEMGISDITSIASGVDPLGLLNIATNYTGFLTKSITSKEFNPKFHNADLNFGRGDLLINKDKSGFFYDRDKSVTNTVLITGEKSLNKEDFEIGKKFSTERYYFGKTDIENSIGDVIRKDYNLDSDRDKPGTETVLITGKKSLDDNNFEIGKKFSTERYYFGKEEKEKGIEGEIRKEAKFDVSSNQENIPSLGFIYVTPAYADILLSDKKFYKIPIQTNITLTGDSIEAEYDKIDFLNRVGSVAQYVRTSSRTCEITTNYFVEAQDSNKGFYTMEKLQEIEYLYKSLVYPQTVKKEESIYLSRPPIINIVYGEDVSNNNNETIAFNKNTTLSKEGVINNFFTNVKWGAKTDTATTLNETGTLFYRSYVITGLAIEKNQEDTPLYMIKSSSDDKYYPKDFSGFQVSLSLLEIDPNYLDSNPVMNDYYNFSQRSVLKGV